MARFECHSHTCYSSIRLLDAISKPRDLVESAQKIGLTGIAITDHEALCCHPEIDKIQQELIDSGSSFKIAKGNEIYLTDTREPKQKYWHFILIAKDAIGHKAMRELSSNAWLNSFFDRGLERVPTLKSELKSAIEKYGKGHIIASSACLGSEIDGCILGMRDAEYNGDIQEKKRWWNQLQEFVNFCLECFGKDFYLEVQPAQSEDQIYVNQKMKSLSEYFGIKMIVTTDSHYLREEDRPVHAAFINSKGGEREPDIFYKYCFLQNTEQIIENLKGTNLDYYELERNTNEIYDKIQNFTLHKKQHVPEEKVPDYPKENTDSHRYDPNKYPTLDYLTHSDNIQERYWVNYCSDKLVEKGLENETYLSRLEEEADTKKVIGEKLETCMFAYPIFLQHWIDLFWECGSPIGAGRGSAGSGLNHYLLGITQTDPIKTNAPWFRYLNKERVELGDIDVDLAPSKRDKIFEKIREERGQLGVAQVATFGTATTKSALLIAARGYHTEEFPTGIDNDLAQYLTSMIPSERGFLWPFHDIVYGNEEKGRKPNTTFLNEIKKYPGLLEIAMKLEGVVVSRSVHASGVNFYGEDPFETACFMKSSKGTITTQYSLANCEYCSDVKFDFLVTQQMDIMAQCITMLQEHGYFDKNLTLRQAYDKYVHPDKIPLEDNKLWDAIDSTDILALFQLNTSVGGNIVRQLVPRTVEELVACNALMRLSGEKGAERPADRYERLKKNPEQWQQELDDWGFSPEEQKVLKKYMAADYGAPSSQEVLMLILMDEDTCHFTLAESNKARKIIAKKKLAEIPKLKEKILKQAKNPKMGEYIWENVIMPQASYSFSRIHGYSYSLVACQAAYLATYYPRVYWNTAYLRTIAGLGEDETTNYAKVARGIGDIKSHGTSVSLLDINRSGYAFEPVEEENEILYGLKALNGLGDEVVESIIINRPYTSLQDFLDKTNCNKTATISLIKAGAFDQFGERKDIMWEYLSIISKPKKRITLQNFAALIEHKLIPPELDFQKRTFQFNKLLKANCKDGDVFVLRSGKYYSAYEKHFDIDVLEPHGNKVAVSQKNWKKQYDKIMKPAKDYLKEHQDKLLKALNDSLVQEIWAKDATGGYAHWEMESLGMYYHDHELARMDDLKYGIIEFNNLDEDPEVDYYFKRNGSQIPIYKTRRIAGTVIAKDDLHSSISILTKGSGVVNVKMTRDMFAMYNRRISEIMPDGTKKVREQGWFQRGTLVLLNGFRRQNTFVLKAYKKDRKAGRHQMNKIIDISDTGDITFTHLRYGVEQEE